MLFLIVIIGVAAYSGYWFFIADSNAVDPTLYVVPQPKFFPKNLNIPENNPLTEEGIKLGKHLFYDGRLSGTENADSLMSCASCHIQSKGFNSDVKILAGKGYPCGFTEQKMAIYGKNLHVTMPLTNLIYNSNGYFRNGFVLEDNIYEGDDIETGFNNLESIIRISIISDQVINSDIERMLEILGSDPMYQSLCKSAFGDEKITLKRIEFAIAQFIRSITATNFKFYHFMDGSAELNESERRGYELFYSETAGCFHCHAGSMMMTTNQYYNNGWGNELPGNCDRAGVTLDPGDQGAYRAPSLINCALNAPYMHDGRYSTLEEVIDFYSEGIHNTKWVNPLIKGSKNGGIQLNSTEKDDLLNFLHTLTDHTLLADTSYACPVILGEFGIQP